jgi:hypothetical protein
VKKALAKFGRLEVEFQEVSIPTGVILTVAVFQAEGRI